MSQSFNTAATPMGTLASIEKDRRALMPNLYLLASMMLVLTALTHSVLGELMIFRQLSGGRLVAHQDAPPLRGRHIRILWASWHMVSVFGLAFALMLYQLGRHRTVDGSWLGTVIMAACLLGALLVLVGTQGRHPGWISLSIASALAGLAIILKAP